MHSAIFVFLLLSLIGDSDAATLSLSHPYGELIDEPGAVAQVAATPPDLVDCTIPPQVVITDRQVTIDVRRVAPGTNPAQCLPTVEVPLAPLASGWWFVNLRIHDAGGGSVVEQLAHEVYVGQAESRCNAYPMPRGAGVFVQHRTMDGRALATRIASDPAFAASIGQPIDIQTFQAFDDAVLYYPPLENPHDIRRRLLATGEFTSVSPDSPACFATPPPDSYAEVVEFVDPRRGHYFYTWDPDEIAGLENGGDAPIWRRTGKTFQVMIQPGCPHGVRETVAYRFFGKPGVGPSSHFFTVDRKECSLVNRTGAWIYEGTPFWAVPLDARGGCPGDRRPLYRLWKPFGESNHRLTPELEVVAGMVAQGWVNEGPAMCVPP